LYVNSKNLKSALALTGSQCREAGTGVIWSKNNIGIILWEENKGCAT
jgi:hypothetical protein